MKPPRPWKGGVSSFRGKVPASRERLRFLLHSSPPLERRGILKREIKQMIEIGKLIINLGIILIFMGVIILLSGKLPFIGKLPGDIYIKKERFSFYAPLGTMLLISFIISLIFTLIANLRR